MALFGPNYPGLPLVYANDLGFIGPKPAFAESFESACRNGPLSTVNNLPVVAWFLSHSANPTYGNRTAAVEIHLCKALEAAAREGNVEAVRMLLDGGAPIQSGAPLHYAAGACPPGMKPHEHVWKPSKEFDVSRIPVMALLVECGADVKQAQKSRYLNSKYAVVHAVAACAVEGAKWLLDAGADPHAKGAWGSAAEMAKWRGEEVGRVFEERVAARRPEDTENIVEEYPQQ